MFLRGFGAACGEVARRHFWSYLPASSESASCGSWQATHVIRGSPLPQHLLLISRYGCDRAL